LETAEALIEGGASPQLIQAKIEQALVSARQNLDEARRSVLDLRLAPLEGHSLPEALTRLVKRLNEQSQPHIEYRLEGTGQPLPSRVEAGLYRVAQEALENIAQHSAAQTASLNLSITPEQVILEIIDNGRGFEPGQTPADRFGLVGMNERMRLMGGSLELKTNPGAGTLIRAVVPLS
jgi:two-component system NarL family sensor kinase